MCSCKKKKLLEECPASFATTKKVESLLEFPPSPVLVQTKQETFTRDVNHIISAGTYFLRVSFIHVTSHDHFPFPDAARKRRRVDILSPYLPLPHATVYLDKLSLYPRQHNNPSLFPTNTRDNKIEHVSRIPYRRWIVVASVLRTNPPSWSCQFRQGPSPRGHNLFRSNPTQTAGKNYLPITAKSI